MIRLAELKQHDPRKRVWIAKAPSGAAAIDVRCWFAAAGGPALRKPHPDPSQSTVVVSLKFEERDRSVWEITATYAEPPLLRITIPTDRPVTFRTSRIPSETPVGIMDASVTVCQFDGATYHLLEKEGAESGVWPAIEMETGTVVDLDFAEFNAAQRRSR